MSATVESLVATDTLLIALDFDGTLAPLVDDPRESRMIPAARTAVDALALLPRTYVALVSGRQIADLIYVTEQTEGTAILLSGSHGTEFRLPAQFAQPDSVAASDEIPVLAESLRQRLAEFSGVWVEEKPIGLVVHTRLAEPVIAEAALAAVDTFADEHLVGWRRRGGHNIVEFSQRQEGKDTAIAVLRDVTGATAVLFAGDDDTDEDAIAALGEGDLGVRVGSGVTSAAVRVADATEMAELLNVIASLRAAQRE